MPDRLQDLRIVDPVLSSIANSHSNEIFVSEKIMPPVLVSKQAGKIPTFGKENFIARTAYRALRGMSNRIPITEFSTVDFETKEHDLEMSLDYQELQEAEKALRYESRVTKELKDGIDLEKEIAMATLLQTVGTYVAPVDLNNAWATPATGTPIANIQTARELIRTQCGMYPNTMVISADAYQLAIACAEVTAMIAYSGFTKVSKDLFSQMVDIPNIYIGVGKKSTDNGESLTNIWTDCCVLAYVDQSGEGSEFNPSFGYLLRKNGMPQVDTYFEVGGKMKVLRCTDNYVPKIVSNLAASMIYDVGA